MCCVSSLLTISVPLVVFTEITSVDGSGFLLFFRLLSQLYQGLGPIDPPPYHEPEAIKFSEQQKGPTPVGTARGESDGFCCVQVDNHATYLDPQLRDEGDETPESNKDGYSDGIAWTVFVRG